MIKLIIGVVVGTLVLLIVMNKVENKVNETAVVTTASTQNEENTYKVTIDGEVNKKGAYNIEIGATLGDLIYAAGGVTDNADDKAYNVSYLLKEGQAFYIAPIYDTTTVCQDVPITKYCINTASEEELLNINGMKSNIAANIIAYRADKKFERIEDLKEVDYIGTATFEKMKNYVTLR